MARPRSRTIPAVARRKEPIPRATDSELIALMRAPRPETRGDCARCEVCELWRDVVRARPGLLGWDGVLWCGHHVDKTLAHCRPCAFVSCKHHLAIDVNPSTGSLKINFPDREVTALEQTCALDVAEEDGATLERVGLLTACTRERIRQIEVKVLLRLRVLQADDV